ncbi:MAG: 3'-5' exonuclease [Candidatus Paceibacterota bacterium]|jgi:DNA polymerase-3 subunit epsilon
MKIHTLSFIDIETTGLNPDIHEIISIGGVLVKQNWLEKKPSFEKIDEFEIKIKPERIEDADRTALKVNKYDPADWVFAYTLKEAMNLFSEKTKDTIMVSHNIAFDHPFIEKALRITGLENKMHFHKLDTISIAFAKLHGNQDIDRFSLRNLGDYFNIKNKNAHTALSDAHTTYLLYKKLMEL